MQNIGIPAGTPGENLCCSRQIYGTNTGSIYGWIYWSLSPSEQQSPKSGTCFKFHETLSEQKWQCTIPLTRTLSKWMRSSGASRTACRDGNQGCRPTLAEWQTQNGFELQTLYWEWECKGICFRHIYFTDRFIWWLLCSGLSSPRGQYFQGKPVQSWTQGWERTTTQETCAWQAVLTLRRRLCKGPNLAFISMNWFLLQALGRVPSTGLRVSHTSTPWTAKFPSANASKVQSLPHNSHREILLFLQWKRNYKNLNPPEMVWKENKFGIVVQVIFLPILVGLCSQCRVRVMERFSSHVPLRFGSQQMSKLPSFENTHEVPRAQEVRLEEFLKLTRHTRPETK